jgi:hypothetical protein
MTEATPNEGPPENEAASATNRGAHRRIRLAETLGSHSHYVKHAEWLKRQGAIPAYARHMFALGLLARRAELKKGAL